MKQFLDLLEVTRSADVAVERVYMGMNSRDRALVQRWACHRDPELRDRAIRQSMLAAEFGISERQVRRILDEAQAQNPTIFKRLSRLRNL
jgi:AraC-like DNA-binding protein